MILYIGSGLLAWALGFAGEYLRPSISGVCTEHRLVQNGPLSIVRHLYYISYVVILVGLSVTLATFWPSVFALYEIIGIGLTIKAEVEQLI